MGNDRIANMELGAGRAFLIALVAASLTTGCEYIQRKELKDERSGVTYRSAVADYTAGRLDAATSGFEKAVRMNPSNASARFQLACLLQDHRKDYFGAACNYREFLLLDPDGDKATLAKTRTAMCEKLLAMEYADRNKDAVAKEMADLHARAADAEQKVSSLTAELESSKKKIAALESENARIRRNLHSLGEDEDEAKTPRAVKNILDDDGDDDIRRGISAARSLGDDEESGDRMKNLKDAIALNAEEEANAGGPALLGTHTDEEKASPKKVSDIFARPRPAQEGESGLEKKPEFYTVAEDDTLMKIAARFYGTRTAWKKIQEANRTTISVDGHIKAGQTIRLP